MRDAMTSAGRVGYSTGPSGTALLRLVEQCTQHVDRPQHRVERGGFHRALAGADLVEQRFQHMGQFGRRGEAEGGRAPLDRVRRAEHRVDELGTAFTGVEREQAGLHRVEPFAALLEVGGVEPLQVDAQGRAPDVAWIS